MSQPHNPRLPGYYEEVPEVVRRTLGAEQDEYFRKNLNRRNLGCTGITASRRLEALMNGEAKSKFFGQYFFAEAIELLDGIKLHYVDGDPDPHYWQARIPKLFTIIDTRALPMCDAVKHIPALARFAERYAELAEQHQRRIKGIDIEHDAWKSTEIAIRPSRRRAARVRKARYKAAFNETYERLRPLLVEADTQYNPQGAKSLAS